MGTNNFIFSIVLIIGFLLGITTCMLIMKDNYIDGYHFGWNAAISNIEIQTEDISPTCGNFTLVLNVSKNDKWYNFTEDTSGCP
jgi:hypothetical protein